MLMRCKPTVLFASLTLALAATGACRAAQPPARTDLYGDPLPAGATARLGTVRLRALQGVSQIAFVPGAKYLATTGVSALSVWDVDTGRVVRTISADDTHLGDVLFRGFAFTPDGKRLLSVGREGQVNGRADVPWESQPRLPCACVPDAHHAMLFVASEFLPVPGEQQFRIAVRPGKSGDTQPPVQQSFGHIPELDQFGTPVHCQERQAVRAEGQVQEIDLLFHRQASLLAGAGVVQVKLIRMAICGDAALG